MTKDKELLRLVRRAWEDGSSLRRNRRRLKAFAYGDQWNDPVRAADGTCLTEGELARRQGRTPITNNIIRRMVKGIIGHYARLTAAESAGTDAGSAPASAGFSPLTETDSRALEEMLISGCAVQYVSPDGSEVENISPERFLFRRFARADASDCTLLGVLRDMTPEEVLLRFSERSPRRAAELSAFCKNAGEADYPLPLQSQATLTDLTRPSLPGTVRVIEVWRRRSAGLLRVHDPLCAGYLIEPPESLERLERENRRRTESGEAPLRILYDVASGWEATFLTPAGELLASYMAPAHPFAVRFYPMIDGEVHSPVEDVVDQQKLVNRLVSTLDQIIASSAKGVLLYPADQLPDGFTWRDVRRLWSSPSGILPFKRTSQTLTPHQVSTSGSSAGATDLLRTQLRLFDEISGTSSSFSGDVAANAGEGILRARMENALISMLDILNSFHHFLADRDRLRRDIAGTTTDKSESDL